MDEKNKTVCFTGKRPNDLLGYDDHNGYEKMVRAFEVLVSDLYDLGFRRFVTGGAQGFDQLMFWAVDRFVRSVNKKDIRNTVYVPFPNQDRLWATDGEFGKKSYSSMLTRADGVIVVTDQIPKTGYEAASFLHKRNHAMVDASSLVIGLCPDDNWKDKAVKGGTSECLRYALKSELLIATISYDVENIVPSLSLPDLQSLLAGQDSLFF